MSKRHQSNRRKAYGRRLHELQERRQRDLGPEPGDPGPEDAVQAALTDRITFFDPRSPRLRYAMGD